MSSPPLTWCYKVLYNAEHDDFRSSASHFERVVV
jgi:hypothetical protein